MIGSRMKNNVNKGLLWLAFILSIIFLLLTNIFSWIKDEDYDYLLSIIGYKWQLTFFVLIILALIFILVYKNIFYEKATKDQSIQLNEKHNDILFNNISPNEEDHKDIMNNLSREEKEILSQYFKNNTKSLDFYDSAVLRTLVKNGVLFNPFRGHYSGDKRDFTLEEWAWKYINKNKNKFN